jgi:hypothetical protein
MFFRKSCNEKLEDNHHSFIISQSVNHPYGLVTNRNGAKGHQLQLAHGLVEALQRVSYAGVGGWGVCVLQTSTTVKSNHFATVCAMRIFYRPAIFVPGIK